MDLYKWLLLKGTIAAEHWPMMVVLLGSSLLNAAYFFPIVYQAFFGKGILPENENVSSARLYIAFVFNSNHITCLVCVS